jgi:NADPH:quinone reductase-like Zn-dependent oxidoreductase
MSLTNRAAWLMAKETPVFVVGSAPYTAPSANELVIKTRAVAINPADVIYLKSTMLLKDYPAILGCDVAGEVVDVHPSLADEYSVGDRVIAQGGAAYRKDGTYCYSSFQEYVVVRAISMTKIPQYVAYEDAVVLPLGMVTALSCVFMEQTLALQWPLTDGEKPGQAKTVLVWGASSSVGACGVQLAVHAGYEVVGIASKKNHEMVNGMGASACFDQSDPNIVEDIVQSLKGKIVMGAYDAIHNDDTLETLCEILDKIGQIKLIASVSPGAEAKGTRGVKIITNFAAIGAKSDVPKSIWQWINRAMENNTIKYMPQPVIVGKGLDDLQKAIELLSEGVSAKKLVVSI